MAEEKLEHDVGLWVLWGFFLLGIGFYWVLAQGFQNETPPLADPGPRMILVWVLGGVAALCGIGAIALRRFQTLGVIGQLGQWCLCHMVGMVGVALAFTQFGPTYWQSFTIASIAQMAYTFPPQRKVQESI